MIFKKLCLTAACAALISVAGVAAGFAPRSPDVEQVDLAEKVLLGNGLAAHRRKRKFGRGFVNESRRNLAGIQIQTHEQEHAHEKENQKRNEILQSQHDQAPTVAPCVARLFFLREVR